MPFSAQNTGFRLLNASERQIVFLTVIGSFFCCFDFTVYVFFKEVISTTFFPENMPYWLTELSFWGIIASGYIFRPIGGIVLSNYGDRYGRKPILMLSLFILTFSTLAIAVLPNFTQVGILAPILLTLFRCVQGFAYGAEVPASWVYVSEHLPRSHVGLACSLVVSSTVLSVLFCSLFYTLLSEMLRPTEMNNFGWRLPFVFGALGTLVSILLRSKLPETRVWLQAYAQSKISKKLPIRVAMVKYRLAMFTTLLLSWLSSSLFLVVLLVIPSISIDYLDVDDRVMAIANGLGTLFGAIGAVVFGVLSDRFNVGKVLISGSIALAMASLVFFSHASESGELVFLLYAILGFCFGVIGVIPRIFVELFPVQVRFSSIAFCYNISYAFIGALTPLLLGVASQYLSLAPALYLVFICLVGVIAGIFLLNSQNTLHLDDLSAKKPVFVKNSP